MPPGPFSSGMSGFGRQRLELGRKVARPLGERVPLVQVGEKAFGQLRLLPLRPVTRLGFLANALETPVDVLPICDDELETKGLEVGGRTCFLREAAENREQRVRLPQLAGDLGTPRHVHDPDRRRGHLLRPDDLREPFQPVVGDHGHPEVRLLGDVRVRGDLRTRAGQRIEERGLPGIGKADDADPECHASLVGEADPRLARVTLHIDDAVEDDGDRPLLRVEHQRPGGAGAEIPVERIGALRSHEPAQDLPAGEPDLDPNEVVSHSQPPP